MFLMHLQQYLSLKNCFSIISLSLTLFLIYKEVINYSITKPTVTSKEVKRLERKDLPEVVVCLVPGFNTKAMLKHNYPSLKYYRGFNNKDKFVGWNGGGSKTTSSQDILDEILTFDTQFINDGGRLVKRFLFMNEHVEHVSSKVKPKMLYYPYGRCMAISPPTQGNTSYTKINSVYLKLNDIATFHNKSFTLHFIDQISSLQLYPNEMEMTGDPIEIKTGRPHLETTYKTQITRIHHTSEDPKFACKVYTADSSYNDCVQKDLLDQLDKELRCQPPLLARDRLKMCNKRFNISNKARLARINKLLKHVYFHDGESQCRPPCSSTLFNTKLIHKAPRTNNQMSVEITFDNVVQVVHSTLSIDDQTFLTRLGGSVSSGRTLLWIFLALIGMNKVRFLLIEYHRK